MDGSEANDPELFDLVHRLLHGEQPNRVVDRRDDPRRSFRCIQLMAFYTPPQMPNAAEFQQIPCDDLSTQGLGFFLREEPIHKHVVIALGNVPFKFLLAEIVRTQQVRHEDEAVYRIGCKFVGRAS